MVPRDSWADDLLSSRKLTIVLTELTRNRRANLAD